MQWPAGMRKKTLKDWHKKRRDSVKSVYPNASFFCSQGHETFGNLIDYFHRGRVSSQTFEHPTCPLLTTMELLQTIS